jgi:hypothetical protein
VLSGDAALARRAAKICAATGIVAAAIFAVCLAPGYPAWFARLWGVDSVVAASIARTQWLVAAVRGLGFALALRALAGEATRKTLALLFLVLIADLAPLGNQVNPRIHRSYFDDVPALVSRLDTGGSRLAHVASMQLGAAERKLYFDSGAGYWVMRNGLWPSTPALHGIETCLELDVDETQLQRTRAVLDLVKELADRGIYDWYSIVGPMYGAGPALVYRDPEVEMRRVGDRWSELEPVEIDRAPRHPRYFFASQVVHAGGDGELADLLAQRRWHPRTAFVRGTSRRVAGGRVRSVVESANRTVLDVEAEGDAMLVLSSTNHKYWRARLDGAAVPIVETNVAFMGIDVPRGRHRIELSYSNPLLAAGAWISLAAMGALGLAWHRRGAPRAETVEP